MNTTDLSFKEDIKEGISVVDFWAPWCGPCRTISPIIDELAKKHKAAGIKVMKMNVDENSTTSASFGIRSIPAIIVFKDGVEIARNVGGGAIAPKVEEMIEKAKQA